MATYKFEQFNTEIVEPTIRIVRVNDNIENRTCEVDIVLTDASGSKFGVPMSGFSYDVTWEDTDIILWVEYELQSFKADYKRSMSVEENDSVEVSEPKIIKVSLWKRFLFFFKRIFKRCKCNGV